MATFDPTGGPAPQWAVLGLDNAELAALRDALREVRDPAAWDGADCTRHPLCRVAGALGVTEP